jgi:hypothetical protein
MNNLISSSQTAVVGISMEFEKIPQVFHFTVIHLGPKVYEYGLRPHEIRLQDGSVIFPDNLETYRCKCQLILVESSNSDTEECVKESLKVEPKDTFSVKKRSCECKITDYNVFEHEFQSAQEMPIWSDSE